MKPKNALVCCLLTTILCIGGLYYACQFYYEFEALENSEFATSAEMGTAFFKKFTSIVWTVCFGAMTALFSIYWLQAIFE